MIFASPEMIVLILVVVLFIGFILGQPVGFTLGGAAVLISILFWPPGLRLGIMGAWDTMNAGVLIALPLYMFMSMILAESGIAEDLFNAAQNWVGWFPGGLAVAIIIVCTLFAAMVGNGVTGTITMGVLALPLMLKMGYDKKITVGAIMAGGGLGPMIPPSAIFILYGAFLNVSVGKLFAAGVIPGLTLAILYMLYIGIRCWIQPELGPAIPKEERASWAEKFNSLKGLVLPIILIVLVLITLFFGIASPSESAAMGAAGSIVCAAINKRFSCEKLTNAMHQTFLLTGKIIWCIIGATYFKVVFAAVGGVVLTEQFINSIQVGPTVILLAMLCSYLVLGCFIDEISILLITLPVYIPILTSLGYDMVWFGVVYLMTAEISALTPPFGMALFMMKGVAPKEVSLTDIWKSIGPFVAIMAIVLVALLIFPQLALWLPKKIGI